MSKPNYNDAKNRAADLSADVREYAETIYRIGQVAGMEPSEYDAEDVGDWVRRMRQNEARMKTFLLRLEEYERTTVVQGLWPSFTQDLQGLLKIISP